MIPHSSARRTPQILRNRRREHGCPACHPPRPVLRYLHGAFDKRIQTARLASHSKTIWFYGAGLRKRFCPGFFSPPIEHQHSREAVFPLVASSRVVVGKRIERFRANHHGGARNAPARALNEAAFDRTNGSTAPAHGAARPDRAALPRVGGQGALYLPGGSRRQKRRAWPRIDFRKTRPPKPYRKAGMSKIRDATGAPWTSPRLPSGRSRKASAAR